MKIYIHIGLHKTGTTYLQTVFDKNRDRLKSQGLLYPQTGCLKPHHANSADANRGHFTLRGVFKDHRFPSYASTLNSKLVKEIEASNAEIVLISSENFLTVGQMVDPELLKQRLGHLGEVIPIVYLRRQDHYIQSLYVEMLSWRQSRISKVIETFLSPQGWEWLDYKERLRPWFESFGTENVIVRSYDDVVASDDLLTDFCEAIGFQNFLFEKPQKPIYASIEFDYINILRALNKKGDLSSEQKSAIVQDIKLNHTGKAPGIDKKQTLLKHKTWIEIADRFREQNAWFVDTFLDGQAELLLFPPEPPKLPRYQPKWSMKEAEALIDQQWTDILSDPVLGHKDNEYQNLPSSVSVAPRQTDLPRLGMIALIKQSADKTENWINYHLNLGVDHIALFLDDEPIADHWAKNPQITVFRCDDAFWTEHLGHVPTKTAIKQQATKTLGKALLEEHGVDWIVGIGGDELLVGSIKEELAKYDDDVSVVKILPAEAILTDDMNAIEGFEARWFKVLPGEHKMQKQRAYEHYSALSDYADFGFFGHKLGRSCVRAFADIDHWVCHSAMSTQQRIHTQRNQNIVLLHFDALPFDAWMDRWKTKLSKDLSEYSISQKREAQFTVLKGLFAEADISKIQAVYKEWYFMDRDALLSLEKDGLVIHVDISDAMFQQPQFGRVTAFLSNMKSRLTKPTHK